MDKSLVMKPEDNNIPMEKNEKLFLLSSKTNTTVYNQKSKRKSWKIINVNQKYTPLLDFVLKEPLLFDNLKSSLEEFCTLSIFRTALKAKPQNEKVKKLLFPNTKKKKKKKTCILAVRRTCDYRDLEILAFRDSVKTLLQNNFSCLLFTNAGIMLLRNRWFCMTRII